MGLCLITAFFVISNALGELTSTSVADEPTQKYINSIEDMKNQNVSWIDSYNLDTEGVLLEKLPEQSLSMKEMEPVQALEYILQYPTKYVFLGVKEGVEALIRLNFWNGKGESPFHFSPPIPGIMPLIITPFLRRGSPYTETITRKILDADAANLVAGKFIPEVVDFLAQFSKVDKKYKEKEANIIAVRLEDLLECWGIYGSVWGW